METNMKSRIRSRLIKIGLSIALLVLAITGCLNQEEQIGVIKNIKFNGLSMDEESIPVNFDQPFSSNNTSYVANIEYEIADTNILAEAGDGSVVESTDIGEKSVSIGENHFQVRVRNEKSGLLRTYYFYVVRDEPDTDSYLKSLELSNVTYEPVFDKKIKTYTATVPYEISLTTVTAITNSEKATIATGDTGIKQLVAGSDNKNIIDIRVTAQDGNIRTYTIIVTREMLVGAEENNDLKNLSVEQGELSPAFIPSETLYQIEVDSDISKIDINAEKYSNKSKIVNSDILTTSQALKVGTNAFQIIVEAENGSRKTYNIVVTKPDDGSASNNNDLKSISVSGITLTPEFISSRTLYEAEVDYSVTSASITVEKKHEKAILENGNTFSEELKVGTNIIPINVIAENGSEKKYILSIKRRASGEASSDVSLSKIELSDITLSPEFDPDIQTYTAEVAYELSLTTLSAITTNKDSKITSELGKKDLIVGTNRIEVIVESPDGNKRIYSILIIRETKTASENNNDLKSLIVEIDGKAQALTPIFNPDELLYKLNLSSSVEKVKISAEQSASDSSLSGDIGEHSLVVGTNAFTINVKSAGGITKSYTLIVKRESNGDNLLNNLSIQSNGTEILTDFNPLVTSYNKEVSYDISEVTIDYETRSTKANLTDESDDKGTHNLKIGDNLFRYLVQAENGSLKVYTVIITRKALDNNAYLKSLQVGDKSLNPDFDKDTYSYIVGVENSVPNIEISAETESETAGISDTGTVNLEEGINRKELIVTAEDGSKKTYTVVINRAYAPSEARLSSMNLSAGEIFPAFDAEKQIYTALISTSVDEVEISAVKSDITNSITINANYESIDGNTINLIDGTNIIEVLAIAQDDTKTNYVIVIEKGKSSINTLGSLSVKSGDTELLNSFNADRLEYSLEVANSVTSVAISVTKQDELSEILEDESNVGSQKLYEGLNKYSISVQAENGSIKEYKINITRALQNSDATLKELTVTKGSLDPVFNRNIRSYNLVLENSDTEVEITGETTQDKANLSGTGTYQVEVGKNRIVELSVEAEDGSKQTYTIVVSRKASSDNTLSSLSVKNGSTELLSGFVSATTSYAISVDYDVTSVNIDGTVNDNTANLTGEGTKSLNVGENELNIVVQAQNGDLKTYTVTITREAQESDADLSDITLNGITLNETFDKNTTLYSADIENSVTSTSISVTKSGSNSDVAGEFVNIQITDEELTNGKEVSLEEGTNIIEIKVIAENGKEKIYTVAINRAYKDRNTNLSNLSLSNGILSPSFSSNETSYTATAENSVTEVTITAETEKDTSSYELSGNTDLEVGSNPVKIVVTAQDGSQKSYVVVVTREGSSDANLSELTLSSGSLSPTFAGSTTSYTATLDYNVTTTTISATANDANAAVTGTGEKFLNVGDNVFEIVVKAEDGTLKTYTVTITRRPPNYDTTNNITQGANISFGTAVEYKVYKLDVTASTNITDAKVYYTIDDKLMEINNFTGAGTKNIIFDNNILIPVEDNIDSLNLKIEFSDNQITQQVISLDID